jgi:hypothetical protein
MPIPPNFEIALDMIKASRRQIRDEEFRAIMRGIVIHVGTARLRSNDPFALTLYHEAMLWKVKRVTKLRIGRLRQLSRYELRKFIFNRLVTENSVPRDDDFDPTMLDRIRTAQEFSTVNFEHRNLKTTPNPTFEELKRAKPQ